jgi:hypothetical protein
MSANKGNAGEHLVMAELLAKGFDAYFAARNNPSFDLACFWQGCDIQETNDLAAIVDLKDGVRASNIYIVPTPIVHEHLTRNEQIYASYPGRSSTSTARVLRFFGEERRDNPSFAYDRKFAEFLDAWDLLKDARIEAARGAVGRLARQLIQTTTL